MILPTSEELDRLDSLLRAASPAPWTVETVPTQVGLCHKIGGGWPERRMPLGGPREQYACVYEDGGDPRCPGPELHANAQLFAEARNSLPALLATARLVHDLLKENTTLRSAIKNLEKDRP